MRLIGTLQGYAAFRDALEEYLPERGIIQSEIIALIAERYSFQGFPRFPPGTPPQPVLNYVGGQFTNAEQSFAIVQLAMYQGGDVVVATTTDQAEMVLDDLIMLLDEKLGFRLGASNMKKHLLSQLVVEFDAGLETYIDKLSNMAATINRVQQEGKPPVNLKRIAFGSGDVEQPTDPLLAVANSDFLIERRQGASYETNRYFCTAPMSTTDHIRILERIEAIARGED
jgi:hypothetical protein